VAVEHAGDLLGGFTTHPGQRVLTEDLRPSQLQTRPRLQLVLARTRVRSLDFRFFTNNG